MTVFYLDESGCTGNNNDDKQQPIFVLGGIDIRDKKENDTVGRFKEIISNYFNQNTPKDFELHTTNLLRKQGQGPFHSHPLTKREQLAKNLLNIIKEQKHGIHLLGIDKRKIDQAYKRFPNLPSNMSYDIKVPYLVAYDYLITHISHFIKPTNHKVGKTTRITITPDINDKFFSTVKNIQDERIKNHDKKQSTLRISRLATPTDSRSHEMIQLADLVVFCARKFYEMETNSFNQRASGIRQFYAECYNIMHPQIRYPNLVVRKGSVKLGKPDWREINKFLKEIRIIHRRNWKRNYNL